jgi:uncharacterized protein (DUF1697 family)
MTKYVAFLRAINVGGHNVKMEELRKLFETFGFSNVETFIASGNIIFETALESDRKLEKQIEAKLHESLGYEVATFIRTTAEIAEIARYKPFDESMLQAAQALNVAFLSEPLTEDAQKTLQSFRTDIDEFHTHGREMYWLCKKKQSESTFSNAIFERKLKVQATFRGWNTILKLAAKYPPDAG